MVPGNGSLATEPSLRITKLDKHIGAEATGIDRSRPLDERTRRQLHGALVENVALVIPVQPFTAGQFLMPALPHPGQARTPALTAAEPPCPSKPFPPRFHPPTAEAVTNRNPGAAAWPGGGVICASRNA